MNHENIMPSEINQTQMDKYLYGSKYMNLLDRKQNGGFLMLGEGESGKPLFNGHKVSVL